jgi:MFS family permease
LKADQMNTEPSIQSAIAPELPSWRKWIEPWYLCYAFLGVAVAGMSPILLPLTVIRAGTPADVGLVMAALSLGGLTAPLWGGLADRLRLHRWLLWGGLLGTALGLVFFPLFSNLGAWIGLALLQGIGAAAASTVANLFIVESHPQLEWDERIGWLQTFYGGGQVAGLVLAGIFGSIGLQLGLFIAAGLTVLAILPARLAPPVALTPRVPRPTLLHPARHGEWPIASPQRLFHHLTRQSLAQMGSILRSKFGLFLAAWLFSFGGTATVFSLYPVLMQRVYNVMPGISSLGFAVAAALGLVLYSPAGRWTDKLGAPRVLQVALGVRIAALAGMLALGFLPFGGQGWLALFAFLLIVLAWSLLSVSGTVRTAKLSPVNEGEGMGVFNATTAVAGVIGAVLGGWAAGQWGYAFLPGIGLVGVVLGEIILLSKGGKS